METLIIYQIPRSIMHDPLPHDIGHHVVNIQAGLLPLFTPTEFTPPLLSLYAQLPPMVVLGLLPLLAPTELAPPLRPLYFGCRPCSLLDCCHCSLHGSPVILLTLGVGIGVSHLQLLKPPLLNIGCHCSLLYF